MFDLKNDRDFPFYNGKPHMTWYGWLALLILVPVSYFAYGCIGGYNEIAGSAVFLLLLLIPVLYFLNWDYSLIFQKPTRNELVLAVLMFLAYYLFSTVMTYVFEGYGLPSIGENTENVFSLVSLLFLMMGEELYKFILLMFFLRAIYKYTSNRRLSIVISSIVTLIFFGLAHYVPADNNLISALIIQGMGSIFHLYVYLKTKNLLVSYLSHLLTDASIIILLMIGFYA